MKQLISSQESNSNNVRKLTKKFKVDNNRIQVEVYTWCTCNGGSWKLETQYFE